MCMCVCVSGLMLMEGGEGVLAITYAPPDTGKDYACVRVCVHACGLKLNVWPLSVNCRYSQWVIASFCHFSILV